jgi:putative membrane protein
MFDGYLWAKTLHIVLIASWFAGLFYLPRIFVNLAQETNEVAYARLIGMAQRLYRFMTILMMPAVALGLILWLYYGVGRGSIWMHVKVLLVLIVIGQSQ